MLSVDNVDNREFLRNLFLSMHNELSVQKKKTPQKNNEEKSLAMIYYPELRAFMDYFLFVFLFPFDSAGRFWGNVKHYTVDTAHFVDNSCTHFGKHVFRNA